MDDEAKVTDALEEFNNDIATVIDATENTIESTFNDIMDSMSDDAIDAINPQVSIDDSQKITADQEVINNVASRISDILQGKLSLPGESYDSSTTETISQTTDTVLNQLRRYYFNLPESDESIEFKTPADNKEILADMQLENTYAKFHTDHGKQMEDTVSEKSRSVNDSIQQNYNASVSLPDEVLSASTEEDISDDTSTTQLSQLSSNISQISNEVSSSISRLEQEISSTLDTGASFSSSSIDINDIETSSLSSLQNNIDNISTDITSIDNADQLSQISTDIASDNIADITRDSSENSLSSSDLRETNQASKSHINASRDLKLTGTDRVIPAQNEVIIPRIAKDITLDIGNISVVGLVHGRTNYVENKVKHIINIQVKEYIRQVIDVVKAIV